MKSAEQWANEIQSAFGDGMSVSAQRRLLEQSVGAVQADALQHGAQLCQGIGDLHSNPDLQEEHYLDAARLNEEAAKLEEAR